MAEVSLDAAVVNALLDIVAKTKDTLGLKAINEVALGMLSKINSELEKKLRPPEPTHSTTPAPTPHVSARHG